MKKLGAAGDQRPDPTEMAKEEDAAAQETTVGAHRSDFAVLHADKGVPAALFMAGTTLIPAGGGAALSPAASFFGRVTSAGTMRTMNFMLRYNF